VFVYPQVDFIFYTLSLASFPVSPALIRFFNNLNMPTMKKVLVLFCMPFCFAACTSSVGTSSTATADSLSRATVSLPYTATYSSNFIAGKQNDVVTILNSFKDWEINDMKAWRGTFGDSIYIHYSSGSVFNNRFDSFMNMATKYRDSLSKVEITVYSWTSNHSVDKNQDWVNIWYKEIDTYKTGKVDSIAYEDDNMLKDGKIVWIEQHTQKLKP
jgi:hypothetical protein